jgi:phospholipase/lecithinase/hemolysin
MSLALGLAACSSDAGDASAQSASVESASVESATRPPSALFVLGDSLSDVGNVAGATDFVLNVPLDPPTVGLCNPTDVLVAMRTCDDLFYRRSRVSDGPVAVEHLAAHLDLAPLRPSLHLIPSQARNGTVYAVAGAKARGTSDEDLARQVDWLLLDHALLPADAIYVLMIGGNDAVDALQAAVGIPVAGATASTMIVKSAVASIGRHVERLVDFGARRLVVANVPDLALLPAVRAAARETGDEPRALASASAVSAAFNRELAAELDDIEAGRSSLLPAPVIVRFDLHAALSGALQALAANGANTLEACFDSERYRDDSTAPRVFHADCAPAAAGGAPRYAGFAFFDGIHPSGGAHAALGAALHEALRRPVPP